MKQKILISLLLVFLVTKSAFADTCATNLMPAFTSTQATALCTKFGDSIAESLIPQSDNSIDLGSASKTWRTLYTGTSRIAKTSDILRVRQDAQRLFTWDAASDTAFTMTWGDGGTTATQVLSIVASTADADDDSTLKIGAGGVAQSDRGGSTSYYGNEVGAGNGGLVQTIGGAVSTGNIESQLGHASASIVYRNASGVQMFGMDNNGLATFTNDAAFATNRTISIQEATAGTACSGTLTANGATPVVTSTTCALTGSRIFLSRTSAETGTVSAWVSALSNGVSFSVTSEAADTGTYNWVIFHEAP